MAFEYDSKKSQANRDKHGIDFEEAQTLWSENIRIISVRRSREEEIELYESF